MLLIGGEMCERDGSGSWDDGWGHVEVIRLGRGDRRRRIASGRMIIIGWSGTGVVVHGHLLEVELGGENVGGVTKLTSKVAGVFGEQREM